MSGKAKWVRNLHDRVKADLDWLKQAGGGKACPVTDLAKPPNVAIEMNCIAL
jgi:hypothetical protein